MGFERGGSGLNIIIKASAAALAAGGLLAVTAATAPADPPALISSVSGACASAPDGPGQYQNLTFPSQPNSYPETLSRLAVNTISGSALANFGILTGDAAGDVQWQLNGRWGPTSQTNVNVNCPMSGGAISATFDILAVPTPPTSFYGAITPKSGGAGRTSTMLAFTAPAAGLYRLSFDVTQGAISYEGTQIASHLDKDSDLDAGLHVVEVRALDGPQARYTLTVTPLPVAMTGFAVQPDLAKQGAPLKIPYTLSGDAAVTIRVLDAGGQPVRVLADQLAAKKGERSVRWDGIGLNGAAVPDGVYTIDLVVSDATGQPHGSTATVTLDRTPPQVTMPSRLSRTRAIVVPVSDPTSGVKSAVLRVNGRSAARVVPAEGRIIYRPRGGFRRGARLQIAVTATDKANNTATATRRYRVR